MARTLYLVAYDVCDPCRLQRVCRFLTGFKVGGQKSVFEIWVTASELRQIRAALGGLMQPEEDRLHILALDPRMFMKGLGKARAFAPGHFSIL